MENWFEKKWKGRPLYIFCPSLDGVKCGEPGHVKTFWLHIVRNDERNDRAQGKQMASAENEILKVRNSLPANFSSLKKLAIALE